MALFISPITINFIGLMSPVRLYGRDSHRIHLGTPKKHIGIDMWSVINIYSLNPYLTNEYFVKNSMKRMLRWQRSEPAHSTFNCKVICNLSYFLNSVLKILKGRDSNLNFFGLFNIFTQPWTSKTPRNVLTDW